MEAREDNKPINWETARPALKKEYPHLSDEDLHFEEGKDEEHLEQLAQKLQSTKQKIRNWLSLMG